jgi:hypothetical protein
MSMANLPGAGSSMEADSKAIDERVRQLLYPTLDVNVIRSVLRDLLPTKLFESIQKELDDWDGRGRPGDGPKDFFISQVVCAVGELLRARRSRIACRRQHIEEARAREISQAIELGGRLRLSETLFELLVGTGPSSIKRGEGGSARAVLDLTASPAWLVPQLESTAAGCRWLAERWGQMRERLGPLAHWECEDAVIMVRLMGKTSRDVLNQSEVADVFLASHALDRRGRNPFLVLRGELSLAEANDLVRRLGPRVKASPEEGDAERGRQTLTAMIDRTVADLLDKAKAHDARTGSDEARKAAEHAFDTSPRGMKLERYEKAAEQSLKSWARTFRHFDR